MKTKILMLFLSLSMIIPQVEAQGLFKQIKQLKTAIQEYKKGQNAQVSNNSKSSSDEASQSSEVEETVEPKSSSDETSQSSGDEVTLVVSADGATKDEAIKVALRSAIEQAYGTFVSANTTILNDELVKDEIVTVASGNIKSYKEIASNVMPDGKTFVTLQTTVCISKLVSYAQSKGAETEFAGATFGMNIKMKELNKQNEIKAWQNLKKQVVEMYKNAFTYQLEVTNPKLIDDRYVSWNDMYGYGGVSSVHLPDDLEEIGLSGTPNDYYAVAFKINIVPTQMMESIVKLIAKTANSLALTYDEREEYEEMNIPIYFCTKLINGISMDEVQKILETESSTDLRIYHQGMYFRSDMPGEEINNEIMKILCNFEIVDNMENASYANWRYLWLSGSDRGVCLEKGFNLFDVATRLSTSKAAYLIDGRGGINLFVPGLSPDLLIAIPVFIHKNDISKYSKFEIRERVDSIVVDDPEGIGKLSGGLGNSFRRIR